MARGRVKENLSNRKITESFQRIPSSRSSRTSAAPSSSPIPVKTLKQTQLTANHFKLAQRKKDPPRPDPEVINVSSGADSASHISISSNSVVTGSDPLGNSGLQGGPPLRVLRPRSTHPVYSVPPLVAARARISQMQTQQRTSPHRRPKLVLPKTNAPIKRKFRSESDSDEDVEEISLPNATQTIATRSATILSSLSGTLAKEHVVSSPTVAEKLLSKPTRSPPKKRRISSPEPCAQPPSSGHEADVEEVIPSSQSDEQELTPSKVIKRRLSDVNEAVQKWRASSLLASPQKCPLSPSPQRGSSSTAEFDVRSDFNAPMDEEAYVVDDRHAEVPIPSITEDPQYHNPASETEVSLQLRQDSSCSEFYSPVDAHSLGPTVPSSPLTNGKSTTSPLSQSPVFAFGGAEDGPSTPPATQFLSMPPTPVALDAESKAAKIIAEIKAKALAAMSDSSDEDNNDLELKELEDSSDDDFDDSFLRSPKDDKGKVNAYVFIFHSI